MNLKIKAKVRSWKPIRSKAQVDLDDILQDEWVIYVSLAGYFNVFRIEQPSSASAKMPAPVRAKFVRSIRATLGRAVFSVATEEQAVSLRDIVCFSTEGGQWRLHWVRNTGLYSPSGGPAFSDRHMEWVAARLYNVWKRYVDPSRRRAGSNSMATWTDAAIKAKTKGASDDQK